MKYHVTLELTSEAGIQAEARPGGPGPLVQRIMERFKPESAHFGLTERAIFFVVDLPTEQDVAEMMVVGSNICGQYPKMTPVVAGKDFAGIAEKVHAGAYTLLKD